MSRYGRCPECEIGDLVIVEYIPDWGDESDATYHLECNHCDYRDDEECDPDYDED